MKIATITRDKNGEFPSHCWPGCYPIIYHNLREDTLCPTCANKSPDLDSFDFTPTDFDIYYEGPSLECDCCGQKIASAYGNPDDQETEDEEDKTPMKPEHCSNCDFPLTEKNIRLACEDAGLPQDELSFCCPSYALEDAPDGKYECCLGYATEDRERPAYWRTA